MFEQVAKLSDEVAAVSEKKRWTWRRFVRTALLAVPAYLTVVVHCAEDVWSKHYDDEATRPPARRQARLWACTWCVFHFIAFCCVWFFARAAAQLYERLIPADIGMPPATQMMLYFGTRGWMFLPLVPLLCWGLYRLRLRGGFAAWTAEVLNGFAFVALVWVAGAISFGAAAPWVDHMWNDVVIEFPK